MASRWDRRDQHHAQARGGVNRPSKGGLSGTPLLRALARSHRAGLSRNPRPHPDYRRRRHRQRRGRLGPYPRRREPGRTLHRDDLSRPRPLAREIKRGLVRLLARDGFRSISEAVGRPDAMTASSRDCRPPEARWLRTITPPNPGGRAMARGASRRPNVILVDTRAPADYWAGHLAARVISIPSRFIIAIPAKRGIARISRPARMDFFGARSHRQQPSCSTRTIPGCARRAARGRSITWAIRPCASSTAV